MHAADAHLGRVFDFLNVNAAAVILFHNHPSGVAEPSEADRTITLKWYQELSRWHEIVKDVEMYGGIVEIES